MDVSQSQILRQQLSADEQLLWEGRPRQGIVFHSADFVLIPFSLLWCGFTIFWEATVLFMGGPFFFKLWGIPFILVGMYLVVGRFIVDAYRRSTMVYGVTSQRIVIVAGGLSTHIKSIDLETLFDVSLAESSNGGGTITFGASQYVQPWYAGTGWPGNGRIEAPSFLLDGQARDIYEIIRTAKRASPTGN